MILLSDLNFNLPLTNPVIVFSLVLFIILFAPILFNKIKVPPIIGLIIAGIIIGPYGNTNHLLDCCPQERAHFLSPAPDKLPYYLSNYFGQNSFIMLYPTQLEHGVLMNDVLHVDSTLIETLAAKASAVQKAGNIFKGFFNKKER
jgi:hypothetical protein